MVCYYKINERNYIYNFWRHNILGIILNFHLDFRLFFFCLKKVNKKEKEEIFLNKK